MPAFMFLRFQEDFRKSSSMKSVRAAAICSFPSLGTTQQNICTNVHSSYASQISLKFSLNACLSEVVPRTLGLA